MLAAIGKLRQDFGLKLAAELARELAVNGEARIVWDGITIDIDGDEFYEGLLDNDVRAAGISPVS